MVAWRRIVRELGFMRRVTILSLLCVRTCVVPLFCPRFPHSCTFKESLEKVQPKSLAPQDLKTLAQSTNDTPILQCVRAWNEDLHTHPTQSDPCVSQTKFYTHTPYGAIWHIGLILWCQEENLNKVLGYVAYLSNLFVSHLWQPLQTLYLNDYLFTKEYQPLCNSHQLE